MDAAKKEIGTLSGRRTPRITRSSTYWARQTHRWLGALHRDPACPLDHRRAVLRVEHRPEAPKRYLPRWGAHGSRAGGACRFLRFSANQRDAFPSSSGISGSAGGLLPDAGWAGVHRFRLNLPCELHPNRRSYVYLSGAGGEIEASDACAIPKRGFSIAGHHHTIRPSSVAARSHSISSRPRTALYANRCRVSSSRGWCGVFLLPDRASRGWSEWIRPLRMRYTRLTGWTVVSVTRFRSGDARCRSAPEPCG